MTPQPQKLSKQSGSITSPPSAPGGGFAGGAPMTPQPPEQEWIISDKDYYIALEYFHLVARPHTSTPPRFNSTELLLLAHDEWKRRQERKHLDDEAAWVSGFIGGFLTDKTWAKDKVDSLRGEP
jgi:hypothetical protein